jgi:hypothetical protein
MTKMEQDDREKVKLDPTKVKAGDLMAVIYYVKVESVDLKNDRLVVQDLECGLGKITVTGNDLIKNSLSADYSAKEEKVSRTRAVELLLGSINRPLTVCFTKKDGTERTLRGRWLGHEKTMGRSFCEDLDIVKTDKEDGVREVDHRTVKWLVVDGVKYTVK